MKKVFSILVSFLFCCMSPFAQDIIVKKDGSIVKAKVTKVSETEIEYKKFESTSDRTYSISVSNVQSITYEDGEVEKFSSEPVQQQAETSGPKLVEKPAAENNETLKNLYKVSPKIIDPKPKDEPAKRGILIFEFTPSSIISNEDLEISFVRSSSSNDEIPEFVDMPLFRYEIIIKNKTNKSIYLDLSNCFRIPSTGNSYCYYNGETTSVTNTQTSSSGISIGGITGVVGGALGLGGSFGSSNSGSVSKIVSQQAIISIPPQGHRPLSVFKYEKVKKDKYTLISRGEELCFAEKVFPLLTYQNDYKYINLNLKKGLVNKDEEKIFTEEDAPYKVNYVITYSSTPDFSTYGQMKFSLFSKKIIGHDTHLTDRNWINYSYVEIKKWLKNYENLDEHLIFGPIEFEK